MSNTTDGADEALGWCGKYGGTNMRVTSLRTLGLVRAAGIAIAFGAPGMAHAQAAPQGADAPADESTGLADIIVVAQKRSQNAQDVPIAITALSGEQLAERGITSVENLNKASPGVLITEFGGSPTTTAVNIRGVAQLDFADHQESPNALYIDGAYLSFPGATGAAMFDLEGLEILRGPQGTLFGRNATGGLIQLNSRKPTDYLDGYVQASYGSYNSANVEGAIGGPIADKLTARLAVSYNRQDGYYRNTLGPDLGRDNSLNARLQLQYKFDEDTKNLLAVSVTRSFPTVSGGYNIYPVAPNPANHGLGEPNSGALFVANCAALGYTVAPGATNCLGYVKPANAGSWDIDQPYIGRFDRTILGFTDTFTKNFGGVTLTSITNYTEFHKNYTEDDGGNPLPIYGFLAKTRAHQVSEELRLSGKSDKLDWVIGAYFLNIKGNYQQGVDFGNFYSPDFITGVHYTQNINSYALFGQAEYKLTDKLSVVAGLRGNVDKKTLDLTGYCTADAATCAGNAAGPDGIRVAGSNEHTDWSGRLQLTYKFDRHSMIYAGVNRGNKGAAATLPASSPFPGTTFASFLIKPEVLTAYEAGFKTSWFDNHLRLNGGVFYYNYSNMQAFKVVGVSALLFNAKARDYGAEFEVAAQVLDHTTVSGNLAYLHTKVEDVSLPDGTIANQQQAFAPHLAVNANIRQEVPTKIGTLFAQGAISYTGSHYFSTVNEAATQSPSYITADFSAGWTSTDKKNSVTVKVANLTNKAYLIYSYNLASFAGYGLRNFAPPRWVSLQLKHNF